MQKGDTDLCILKTALDLDNYDVDSDDDIEGRDEFFCSTFTLHGDMFSLDQYCDKQRQAFRWKFLNHAGMIYTFGIITHLVTYLIMVISYLDLLTIQRKCLHLAEFSHK